MSEFLRPTIVVSSRSRRARRGQTLIVALAVLFILLVIGALFVTRVASNLTASGRGKDVATAQSLASAGIQYVASQLDSSELGADWRPTPTPPFSSNLDPNGQTDPDYDWLVRGFSRVVVPGGRYLVRVVYDPRSDDARSQFLRIESVGRTGDIGTGQDPTVFVQNGLAPRLRSEKIAYKQIGLTDYLMFVTGLTRSQQEATIGIPTTTRTMATAYGDPTIAQGGVKGTNNDSLLIGAPMRFNTNLNILGDTFIYESPRNGGSSPNSPEGVLSNGSIRLTPNRDVNGDGVIDEKDVTAGVNVPVGTPVGIGLPNGILPSTDQNFTTQGGYLRDGSNTTDPFGYPRSVSRLEPPVLDTYVNGSGVSRYRALTRESGKWFVSGTNRFNTGQYGWGKNIYIDNRDDLQPESARQAGVKSLPREWTDPTAYSDASWHGLNYLPPGVYIELLGDRIRFTRDAKDRNIFRKPTGEPLTSLGGKVWEVPLREENITDTNGQIFLGRANYNFPDDTPGTLPDGTRALLLLDNDGDINKPPYKSAGSDQNSYGVNLTIFCEGNARVRGVYGAVSNLGNQTTTVQLGRVHLTIVSGGTIYVEGSVVKGDGVSTGPNTANFERASTCALLAHDYICVNTTMFTSPINQTGPWDALFGVQDAFTMRTGLSNPTIDTAFSWGVDPTTYKSNGSQSPIYMLLRHAAEGPQPSLINLLFNPGTQTYNNGKSLYDFSYITGLGAPDTVYPLGLKQNGTVWDADPHAIMTNFEQIGLTLNSGANAAFINPVPGFDNIARFQTDTTSAGQGISSQLGAGGTSNYVMGNMAVAPMDVRIEALMYAQEKCFFIIPGYPLNPDRDDSRTGFLTRGGGDPTKGTRTSYSALDNAATQTAKDIYPFYNEPTDIRLTIFGAIAQNYTASVGDQEKWMERWGYIPASFGSTATQTPIVVPDDHLNVHDPDGYVPGEDRTQDFRTDVEKNPPETLGAANAIQRNEITRGLRFVYDPSFALPYFNAAKITPGSRLRYRYTDPVIRGGNTVYPSFYQTLPAIPRLPVCPGFVLYGNADKPL